MPRVQTDLGARPPQIGAFRFAEPVAVGGRVVAIRVEDFFAPDLAQALADYLDHLVYERDDIADQKHASRAVRQGELPDDPLLEAAGAPAGQLAHDALAVFEHPWLIGQFEQHLGTPLRVLRPPTPYRLDVADFIEPHDDHPAPEYRLSVACNLTTGWRPDDGGETVVGLVDAVTEFDDPYFPFPLKNWAFGTDTRTLAPRFNSALLLPLSDRHAHAVRPVRRGIRYSITTLYGDKVPI